MSAACTACTACVLWWCQCPVRGTCDAPVTPAAASLSWRPGHKYAQLLWHHSLADLAASLASLHLAGGTC